MILIIEDDLVTSSLFKDRLDFYKITYKIANSGLEAYKILFHTEKKDQFKFIITSIGLPDENGVEIIKFIKQKFTSKIFVYTSKNYYKDKIQLVIFYDKKIYSPSEVIDLILSDNNF